jgi:hypothetical protein
VLQHLEAMAAHQNLAVASHNVTIGAAEAVSRYEEPDRLRDPKTPEALQCIFKHHLGVSKAVYSALFALKFVASANPELAPVVETLQLAVYRQDVMHAAITTACRANTQGHMELLQRYVKDNKGKALTPTPAVRDGTERLFEPSDAAVKSAMKSVKRMYGFDAEARAPPQQIGGRGAGGGRGGGGGRAYYPQPYQPPPPPQQYGYPQQQQYPQQQYQQYRGRGRGRG